MHERKRQRWIRFSVIVALFAWGVFVISCTTMSSVLVAPPDVPGATFVGSAECVTCHQSISHEFATATHANLHLEGGNAVDIGCESCHGPGSAHVQAGGGMFSIVNPERSPETCFQCHIDKRGEFALTSSHPVMSGDISCNDCHDPHSGAAISGGGTQLLSSAESCLQCHQAQRGPFVFEHEASREGCTVCHNPHGSVNAKMLKSRNATLCLQCHFQVQTAPGRIEIGGRDHSAFLSRGTCWQAGCHEAVHGSHVNSSLRF